MKGTNRARHGVCTKWRMGQTLYRRVRSALAGLAPAVLLVACGTSTGGDPGNQGGAGAVAGENIGGAKAGSGSSGVSGGAAGASGSGGSLNRAGSAGSGDDLGGHGGSSGANAAG